MLTLISTIIAISTAGFSVFLNLLIRRRKDKLIDMYEELLQEAIGVIGSLNEEITKLKQ